MREIDAATAASYLRDGGWVTADERVDVREMTGGVSNIVLYVHRDHGSDFVLKQARGQLRVAEPWFCGVERIWREADVLKTCGELLKRLPEQVGQRLGGPQAGGQRLGVRRVGVPQVLWEDRPNYVFAMSAAERTHLVWKSQLLAGIAELEVAEAAGRLLAGLHAASWQDAELSSRLRDRQFFEQLRVDPYYRHVARGDPGVREALDGLIGSLNEHPCGLVHGDFSPKNLLLESDRLLLVDCEVGHYGDVAFDVGFFLTHLVLKTFQAGQQWPRMLPLIGQFWTAYRDGLRGRLSESELGGVEARGLWHLAGCGLARLDGKSPVEYLVEPRLRDKLRQLFRTMLRDPPERWESWEPQLRAQLELLQSIV